MNASFVLNKGRMELQAKTSASQGRATRQPTRSPDFFGAIDRVAHEHHWISWPTVSSKNSTLQLGAHAFASILILRVSTLPMADEPRASSWATRPPRTYTVACADNCLGYLGDMSTTTTIYGR